MYRYLWLQWSRQKRSELKHHLLTYATLILCTILIFRTYHRWVDVNIKWMAEHREILAIGIALFQALVIGFRKNPVLYMYPALFHFFHHSKKMKTIRTLLWINKALRNLVLTVLLFLPFLPFTSLPSLLLSGSCFWHYAMIGSVLRRLKYHRANRRQILLIWSASNALFLLRASGISWTGVGLIPVFLWSLWESARMPWDWGRYYEDCLNRHRIETAFAHHDMAEMQQCAAEAAAQQRYRIRLHHFPLRRRNALFFKSVIETLRIGKVILFLFALLSLLAVAVIRTDLLEKVGADRREMELFVCISIIGSTVGNIREIFLKQIASLKEKARQSCLIPYSDREILVSYGLNAALITTCYLALMSFFLTSGMIGTLICASFYHGLLLLSLLLPDHFRHCLPVKLTITLLGFLAAYPMIP